MKYINYFTDLTHTGAGVNSYTFPLGVANVAAYAAKYLPSKFGYRADPNQMKIEKTKFKLSHDDKTLDYIKKLIDLYSKDDRYQIGKMFQRTNMEVMSRKIYKLKS